LSTNTKSTNLWIHELVIFNQTTKIDAHEEKYFHSMYNTHFLSTTSNKQNILLNFIFNSRVCYFHYKENCISDVIVSVLDHGFKSWSGQKKDYKNGICCFSAKHAALRRKSKDWLARNQDNVSELGDMSIHGLLFQWASTLKIQPSLLV
jgi:hypothetical protein